MGKPRSLKVDVDALRSTDQGPVFSRDEPDPDTYGSDENYAVLERGLDHMAGKPVRGARVTEMAQPDVRAIREGRENQSIAVRKADRRKPPHPAELGATSHAPHRSRAGAAQDRGIQPEGRDRGAALV